MTNGVDHNVIKPTITEGVWITPEMMAAAIAAKGPMLGAWRTCITCMHFSEKTERCAKNGQQRPPARVIAYGCPDYDCDNIPY